MPPRKLPRACAYPGCPETTTTGQYCALHRSQVNREYNRDFRRSDYYKTYGRRWHTIRDLYIAKHPLCEECLKSDKLTPAVLVHHIKPTDVGGTHDESNLMALCNSCHNKIHDRGGS